MHSTSLSTKVKDKATTEVEAAIISNRVINHMALIMHASISHHMVGLGICKHRIVLVTISTHTNSLISKTNSRLIQTKTREEASTITKANTTSEEGVGEATTISTLTKISSSFNQVEGEAIIMVIPPNAVAITISSSIKEIIIIIGEGMNREPI